MSFDATWRVALENNAAPGSFNAQLVTELTALDKESVRLRKIGKNPIDELQPKVDALRAAVSRVGAETIQKGRERLDQYREEFGHRRDKHAQVEIMKQADAKLLVNAMADSEIEALTMSYLNGQELDISTLRELQARTRQPGELEHLALTLRTKMDSRRAAMPWISENPDATALADEVDNLTSTPPGSVKFVADDTEIVVEVGDLVDFGGELSAPI